MGHNQFAVDKNDIRDTFKTVQRSHQKSRHSSTAQRKEDTCASAYQCRIPLPGLS